MSEPRILALDLSLTRTGICTPTGKTWSFATATLRGMDRVDAIVSEVHGFVTDTSADLVAIEGYSFGSQGRSVFNIGELGGCVRLLLHRLKVPFVEVPPSTLKKFSTGRGNADKDAMILAAVRRFGFEGETNDEADAFLLWCLARHAYGSPVATVPVPNQEAIAKVSWPDLAVPTAC